MRSKLIIFELPGLADKIADMPSEHRLWRVVETQAVGEVQIYGTRGERLANLVPHPHRVHAALLFRRSLCNGGRLSGGK